MSDPVSKFVAGLDILAAAPGRRGLLVIYQVDVLAGQTIETAVEAEELANWPVAPQAPGRAARSWPNGPRPYLG
jgi:hypothetical protein